MLKLTKNAGVFGVISAACAIWAFAAQPAHAEIGKYVDSFGKKIESCVRTEMTQAPATTLEALQPGETWACVTLSYLWDEQDHSRLFVENFSRGDYLFDSASIDGPTGTMIYPRNVIHPNKPVEYTIFAYEHQTGVREDLQVGMDQQLDYIVAVNKAGANFLLVERSLRNANYHLDVRPSLNESPFALLDFQSAQNYERDYGRSVPSLYRRVTQYLGCYRTSHPEQKKQVPCFGDLDGTLK